MPAKFDDTTLAAIRRLREEFNATVPEELLQRLPNAISIEIKSGVDTEYQPEKNLLICNPRRNLLCATEREIVMPHELAHAIHRQLGIVTDDYIEDSYLNFIGSLRGCFEDYAELIANCIWDKYYAPEETPEMGYRHMLLLDVIGGMTKGEYGSGHSSSYYLSCNGAERELFAHAVSLNYLSGPLPFIHQALDQLLLALSGYGLKIIKGVMPLITP